MGVRGRGGSAGYTLVELAVGSFLALFVVLALGHVILQNQRSWEWGRDKAVLQQNATEGLERMVRAVRAARRLEVISESELRTYDETDALVHTLLLDDSGDQDRLLQDGADLIDRQCTLFVVTPDDDTTSVQLDLEIADNGGNRVAVSARATLRNRTFVF